MGEQTTPWEPFERGEAQGFHRQERPRRKVVKGGMQIYPGQRKTQMQSKPADSSLESERLQGAVMGKALYFGLCRADFWETKPLPGPWDLVLSVGLDSNLERFPSGSVVKNLPAMQDTQVWTLDWEDPLEKEMGTHSSIFAWKSHRQRSLAGYSPWGQTQFSN